MMDSRLTVYKVGLTRFGGHPRSVLYGVHNAGQQGKEKSSQELYG